VVFLYNLVGGFFYFMDKRLNEPIEQDPEPVPSRLKLFGKRIRSAVPFISGVFAALLALILYNFFFPGPHQLTVLDVNNTIAQVMASATPPPAYSARVYQTIQPSLVLIEAKAPGSGGEGEIHLGSGVVISIAGAILTSLHVVDDAQEIWITFADGSETTAQIDAIQEENDIAVLIPDQLPPLLVPAVLGNPGVMRVGDEAFAVGNPFGLYSSISAGVISGFDRSFRPPDSGHVLENLIQIDAAVNPGNSGGPLLNRQGQVVGIVVGIVNPTEQEVFIGIGFAVPITIAGSAAGLPPY
jgi:S1-C subfamily serine protease